MGAVGQRQSFSTRGLGVATCAVVALAFLAGRAMGSPHQPAPPARPPAQPSAASTVPAPGQVRALGWWKSLGGVTLVLDELRREGTGSASQIGTLRFTVRGLPADNRVVGLEGAQLLAADGMPLVPGTFPSTDQLETRAIQLSDDQYDLALGPIPPVGTLDQVLLRGIEVATVDGARFTLDTSGPWPSKPPLRPVTTDDPVGRVAATPGSGSSEPVAVTPGSGSAGSVGPTSQAAARVVRVGSDAVVALEAAMVGGDGLTVLLAVEPLARRPGVPLVIGAEARAGSAVIGVRAVRAEAGSDGIFRAAFSFRTPARRRIELRVGTGYGTVWLRPDHEPFGLSEHRTP